MVEEKNCDIPINGINQGHQNQVDASFCKKQKLNYLNCKTTTSSPFLLPQGNNCRPKEVTNLQTDSMVPSHVQSLLIRNKKSNQKIPIKTKQTKKTLFVDMLQGKYKCFVRFKCH